MTRNNVGFGQVLGLIAATETKYLHEIFHQLFAKTSMGS